MGAVGQPRCASPDAPTTGTVILWGKVGHIQSQALNTHTYNIHVSQALNFTYPPLTGGMRAISSARDTGRASDRSTYA